MTNRAVENLALLDTETARLLESAARLDDAAMREPSRCTGWTRAHVITHVARNADALVNLVRWAADGRERQAYVSEQIRAAEIEEGAHRSASEIVDDLETSAARFRSEAEVLTGPAGEVEVHSRVGTPVTGAQIVAMRVLEVVVHHVDLRTGFSFDDVDPGWAVRTLSRGVRQWSNPPALTLRPEASDPLTLGDGGAVIRGTLGELLLWLVRGDASALESDAPLPTPPPWG